MNGADHGVNIEAYAQGKEAWLMKLLMLKGAIVSLDAMGCQPRHNFL